MKFRLFGQFLRFAQDDICFGSEGKSLRIET